MAYNYFPVSQDLPPHTSVVEPERLSDVTPRMVVVVLEIWSDCMMAVHTRCEVALGIWNGYRGCRMAARIRLVVLEIWSGCHERMRVGHIRLVVVLSATGSYMDQKRIRCCMSWLAAVLVVAWTSCCFRDG